MLTFGIHIYVIMSHLYSTQTQHEGQAITTKSLGHLKEVQQRFSTRKTLVECLLFHSIQPQTEQQSKWERRLGCVTQQGNSTMEHRLYNCVPTLQWCTNSTMQHIYNGTPPLQWSTTSTVEHHIYNGVPTLQWSTVYTRKPYSSM